MCLPLLKKVKNEVRQVGKHYVVQKDGGLRNPVNPVEWMLEKEHGVPFETINESVYY